DYRLNFLQVVVPAFPASASHHPFLYRYLLAWLSDKSGIKDSSPFAIDLEALFDQCAQAAHVQSFYVDNVTIGTVRLRKYESGRTRGSRPAALNRERGVTSGSFKRRAVSTATCRPRG